MEFDNNEHFRVIFRIVSDGLSSSILRARLVSIRVEACQTEPSIYMMVNEICKSTHADGEFVFGYLSFRVI